MGVAPTFYPAPFKESGSMIGAVPTHGHIKLGPRQRHGQFGARLYALNSAQPVHQTDCRDHLESGNTMDLSIRSGHSLLTCPPTTCFKDKKELGSFFGSYLHTHPEYSTQMQSSPYAVHHPQFQSQWPIGHHNS